MGRRDRDRIRLWAEGLVEEHRETVARLIGLDPPLPPVTIEVEPDGPPDVTGARSRSANAGSASNPTTSDASCTS